MGVLLDALRSVDFLEGLPEEARVRFMVLGRGAYHRKRDIVWKAETPARRTPACCLGLSPCRPLT